MRDGKIVWLDMGMMGSLSERERGLIGKAISGIARGDVNLCRDAVLGLGQFSKGGQASALPGRRGAAGSIRFRQPGRMDLARVFEDLTEVMKRNGISMPGSLTMLARGLAQDVRAVYESAHKSLEIPSLMADLLRTGLKGEANVGVEHHAGEDLARLLRGIALEICATIIVAALVICGGLMFRAAPAQTSWGSVVCFALSVLILGGVFGKRRKKKNELKGTPHKRGGWPANGFLSDANANSEGLLIVRCCLKPQTSKVKPAALFCAEAGAPFTGLPP